MMTTFKQQQQSSNNKLHRESTKLQTRHFWAVAVLSFYRKTERFTKYINFSFGIFFASVEGQVDTVLFNYAKYLSTNSILLKKNLYLTIILGQPYDVA